MPDYTFRITVSTDPQTFTFASLSTSLEGRTVPTVPATTNKPVVDVQEEGGDRRFRVSAVNSSGGNWVSFTLDASDFGVDLPVTAVVYLRTFSSVSSVSNAKSATVDYIRRILSIEGVGEIVSDAVIQERIDNAVHIYSNDRPRNIREEVAGNSEFRLTLPSAWVDEFSLLKRLEHPGGDQIRQFEDENDYEYVKVDTTERTINTATSGATSVTTSTASQALFFRDGDIVTVKDGDASETNWVSADGNTTTGVVALKNAIANTYDNSPKILKQNHILLRETAPVTSDYLLMEYNGRHLHTDSSDTIPTVDYDAFAHLAASLVAETIASQMAKHISSDFGSDTVSHLENSATWMVIAEAKRKVYDDHLRKGEDVPQTAFSKVREIDSRFTWGTRFLFHNPRTQ